MYFLCYLNLLINDLWALTQLHVALIILSAIEIILRGSAGMITAGWMFFVATSCVFVWLCYALYPSIVLFFRQCYYFRGLSYVPPHWLLGHLHVVSRGESK